MILSRVLSSFREERHGMRINILTTNNLLKKLDRTRLKITFLDAKLMDSVYFYIFDVKTINLAYIYIRQIKGSDWQ